MTAPADRKGNGAKPSPSPPPGAAPAAVTAPAPGSEPLQHHQWEAFARHVAGGSTQLDAYREAGYSGGAPEACKLAHRHQVKQRIDWLKQQAAEQVTVTAAEIIRELKTIALADPDHIFDDSTGLPMLRPFNEMGEARKAIEGVEIRKGRGMKVKLASKLGALRELAQIKGLTADRGGGNVVVIVAPEKAKDAEEWVAKYGYLQGRSAD